MDMILASILFVCTFNTSLGRTQGPRELIICDAGSTGTRLYLYLLESNGSISSKALHKVFICCFKKTGVLEKVFLILIYDLILLVK